MSMLCKLIYSAKFWLLFIEIADKDKVFSTFRVNMKKNRKTLFAYLLQCPVHPNTTRNIDAFYTQFVASGPVIGKSVNPINDKPVYIKPSLLYDFIAVAEVGNYHLIFLIQRKYFGVSINFVLFFMVEDMKYHKLFCIVI